MGLFVNAFKSGSGFIAAYLTIYVTAALLLLSGISAYLDGKDKNRAPEKWLGVVLIVVGGIVFLPSIVSGAAAGFGESLFQ